MQQQHLQLVGIKAQSTYSSLHAGNITVVVSAPQVDDAVEATLEFVAVISDIGSKVGGHAVVTDNNAVLVIAVSGGIKPFCAVLFINAAFFLKEFASLTYFIGIMQGLLAEPYIEGYAKSFQIFFQACQLFFISNFQEFCQTLFFL